MLTASTTGTALAIAAVLGASVTAYLWRVRRPQLEINGGIKTLAAMRWREFSHFVIDALREQGFEPDLEAPQPQKGEQADLLLTRDDKPWLLSCKQGVDQMVMAPQVSELARSVRESGAVGGILATLGKIDPAARTGNQAVEVVDGVTLWNLIEPLLPPSLQDHLAKRARDDALRGIQLAWLVSLLLGFLLAIPLTPAPERAPAAVAAAVASTIPPGSPVSPADAVAPAPAVAAPEVPAAGIQPEATVMGTEDERRDEAMRMISALPGIEKAMWATRSTLVVYLEDAEASPPEVASLCATLEGYDELRASRLQLQPITGSGKPVRFMQCRAY